MKYLKLLKYFNVYVYDGSDDGAGAQAIELFRTCCSGRVNIDVRGGC
jgi:hypothetical protein